MAARTSQSPGLVPAILELAPELFAGALRTAQRAADAVDRRLRGAPVALIPALDRAFRDAGLHRRLGRAFLDVHPAEVARLDRLERSRSAALGVASLVRSGHAREAAVVGLRGALDPLATAFLVARLNDYVPAIGDLAWSVLEDRLRPHLAALLVPSLPLVDRMGAWVRAADARRRRLRAFLLQDDPRCRAALWHGARAAEADAAWAAARLLLERHRGEPELRAVYEAALGSPSPRVRLWAARAAADRRLTPPAVLDALAPRLAADRLPALRVVAVHLAAARGDRSTLHRAAFDPNAAVRHHARLHLARAPLDYRGLALAALARPDLRRDEAIGALATLSDFGRPEDRPIILPYAADPRPRVAREATRTLTLLDRLYPDATFDG